MVGLDIEGRVKEYDEYLTTHCRFVLVGRIEKIWGSTIIDQSTSLSSKWEDNEPVPLRSDWKVSGLGENRGRGGMTKANGPGAELKNTWIRFGSGRNTVTLMTATGPFRLAPR